MNITKSSYDYCEISENQGEYLVEYGYQTYNGKIIYPPIKIGDRSFATEKKAMRYAKKIAAKECIRLGK
jgi:hypothetical protein